MAFDYNTIKYMNMFTPAALADEFMELYKFENGEKKVIEIVRCIENSDKVQKYLDALICEGIKPSARGLETLMNTISYFMFSKEETLCLGGLATFIMWRNRFMIANNIYDSIEQDQIDSNLTPICTDFINNCSRNKYNKSNNIFLRFEKRILKIGKSEGLN